MANSRWELTRKERIPVRLHDESSHVFMAPINNRLQVEELQGKRLLTMEEMILLTRGIQAAIVGDIPRALFMFEERLMPARVDHDPIWHACVLLWSALCRLYLCDPATALQHVHEAEEKRLINNVPELLLAKGMSLRLSGRFREAIGVLRSSGRRGGYLQGFATERKTALAWLIESQVAGGIGKPTLQQFKWLSDRDRFAHGTIGVYRAATYRVGLLLEADLDEKHKPPQLLAALDHVAAFERPMLTMLLEDVLPRPLKGVQPATEPPEAYWKSEDA
jgi:hypothetical protein